MRHPRILIASISLAAAAAIGGGVTVLGHLHWLWIPAAEITAAPTGQPAMT